MMTFEEKIAHLSEASVQYGISMIEAATTVWETLRALGEATAYLCISVAKIIKKYNLPPDETLKELAIGREGHLLNYAKKGRTRKKYRNRLIKRYYNKIQIEEQTDEKSGTNY